MTILRTQERLHKVQEQERVLKQLLEEVKDRIEVATQSHKEQIARSLSSEDEEEREMAERVANWYQIPIPQLMMEAIDLHRDSTDETREQFFQKLQRLKEAHDITEDVRKRCIMMMQCGS